MRSLLRAVRSLFYRGQSLLHVKYEECFFLASMTLSRRAARARREGILPDNTNLAKGLRVCLLGHGHQGDGEWVVCRETIKPGGVVHSYGIGTNLEFEIDLVRRFGVVVRAFDPTPLALEWVQKQQLLESIKVYPWGIADEDGNVELELPEQHVTSFVKCGELVRSNAVIKATCPVKRFPTICHLLGDRSIEILKLDVEGFEYGVVPDVLAARCRIGQLLVEFHHRWDPLHGVDRTRKCLGQIFDAGYELFFISASGLEYSLRLRP